MAVFRVEKNKDYTTMSNYHFKERKMSLKAKGLLSQMLSLPDDWDYTIAGLATINKENEGAIKTALDELKKFGYLVVNKKMPNETETGRIEYEYIVYEKPKQGYKKQGVEIQGVEIQHIENSIQLNTNKLNTKILNNKKEKITLEEIEAYIKEKGLKVNAKQFFDYFETGNWVDSKGNKVKNWKQKLLTWNKYADNIQKKTTNYEQNDNTNYNNLYEN